MGWPWDRQEKEPAKSTEVHTQAVVAVSQPETQQKPAEKLQVGPSDVVVVGCGVITLGGYRKSS
jgi:hypothetical protein